MKPLAALLPAFLLLSACSSTPRGGSFDRPTAQEEGNSRDVPLEVIAALPERILRSRLQPDTNPLEYIDSLGLGPWTNNLFKEEKFDSYFLYLDRHHMLQIHCHPDSLSITEAEARAIQARQNLSSSPFWIKDPIVIGATLRQDWDEILIHRIY